MKEVTERPKKMLELARKRRDNNQAFSGESVPGRQPKLYNPISGQPGTLWKWQECHSTQYESMNCKNDLETIT